MSGLVGFEQQFLSKARKIYAELSKQFPCPDPEKDNAVWWVTSAHQKGLISQDELVILRSYVCNYLFTSEI